MLYFVSGFIFICVFNFIVSNQNPHDYKNIIMKSLIVGYILTLFYHIVPSITNNNQYIDISIFLSLCVVFAYICGRLYEGNFIRVICKKLKIRSTVNEYIWYDIEDHGDKPLWVKATIIDQGIAITGQLVIVEEYQRMPMLVLNRYIIEDLSRNIIEDNDEELTKRILVDTQKCDRIELIYDKNSINLMS